MNKISAERLKLANSKGWYLAPRRVRWAIIGRGLLLDPETFSKTLSVLEKELIPAELKRCRCLLKLREGSLSNPGREFRQAFGPYWRTCILPLVMEDTVLSFNTPKDGETPSVLRKDSPLFANECSFMLGALEIFLPGVFPAMEIDIYEVIGSILSNI